MFRNRMIGLGLMLILFVSQSSLAQEAIYQVTPTSLDGPEQLEAGFHTFTMQTDGESGYSVILFQLKEGITLEAFIPLNEAVDAAFNGGDPAAAMTEALKFADIVFENGPNGGQTQSTVGVTLVEGSYVFSSNEDVEGPSIYSYKALEVVANSSPAEEPQADQTIQLVDFAFALPSDIKAGEQTWHIVNQGTQPHHGVIFKLKEGKTLEDVKTFMASQEGEPPFEDEGGAYIGMLSPQRNSYMTVNLSPGDYVVSCFLPDLSEGGDGAEHFTHGMIQVFTIPE